MSAVTEIPSIEQDIEIPWLYRQENIVVKYELFLTCPSATGDVTSETSVGSALFDDRTTLIVSEGVHLSATCGVTSEIEAFLIWLLSKRIRIPQPADVRDYLLRYPDMIALLWPVCQATHSQFSPPAQLSLEVYQDSEIKDQYLTIYIRQQSYDDTVMQRIKEIRASYERMLAARSGWLLVTTDFRSLS